MTDAEAQSKLLEGLVTFLQLAPYISAVVLGFLLIFCCAYIWWRERLHRQGKLHRDYDGWNDGYTVRDVLAGRLGNDEHLWERDAQRSDRITTKD